MKITMSIWPVITRLAKSMAGAVFGDRHLAHRGADVRHAAGTLDQPGHFGGAAAFEGRNVQAGKSSGVGRLVTHSDYVTCSRGPAIQRASCRRGNGSAPELRRQVRLRLPGVAPVRKKKSARERGLSRADRGVRLT